MEILSLFHFEPFYVYEVIFCWSVILLCDFLLAQVQKFGHEVGASVFRSGVDVVVVEHVHVFGVGKDVVVYCVLYHLPMSLWRPQLFSLIIINCFELEYILKVHFLCEPAFLVHTFEAVPVVVDVSDHVQIFFEIAFFYVAYFGKESCDEHDVELLEKDNDNTN